MKALDASRCSVCGASAVDVPRLSVEQDRHYDCPRTHAVGLCAQHGAALREGKITPHSVLYDWIQRNHADLYDGTRLYFIPQASCLACNAAIVAEGERVACAQCGAINVIGTALGHSFAIQLEV